MNDDFTQPDEPHAAASRLDDRDSSRTLPWLDDAAEELFRATPAQVSDPRR